MYVNRSFVHFISYGSNLGEAKSGVEPNEVVPLVEYHLCIAPVWHLKFV